MDLYQRIISLSHRSGHSVHGIEEYCLKLQAELATGRRIRRGCMVFIFSQRRLWFGSAWSKCSISAAGVCGKTWRMGAWRIFSSSWADMALPLGPQEGNMKKKMAPVLAKVFKKRLSLSHTLSPSAAQEEGGKHEGHDGTRRQKKSGFLNHYVEESSPATTHSRLRMESKKVSSVMSKIICVCTAQSPLMQRVSGMVRFEF